MYLQISIVVKYTRIFEIDLDSFELVIRSFFLQAAITPVIKSKATKKQTPKIRLYIGAMNATAKINILANTILMFANSKTSLMMLA